MKVIVTGGSGKAGAYTVRELAGAGHEVVNLDAARQPDGLPSEFIQLNLTDAGEVYDAFAQVRPEGTRRIYTLDTSPLRGIDDWLERFRVFWPIKLDALATEVARGKKVRGEPL